MSPILHYVVKVKLIRQEGDILKFDDFAKEFVHEEPIIARKLAFDYYESLIDVLLESKGLKNLSYRQSEKALKSFFTDPHPTSFKIGEEEIVFDLSYGFGIGVFLSVDEQIKEVETEDKELLIHSIGNLWENIGGTEDLMWNLEKEYEVYKNHNLDNGGIEISVKFLDRNEWFEGYREDEPQTYTILKTPFDWTGFDQPPSELNEPEVSYKEPVTYSFEELISKGETNQVEFKPALVYNFLTGKGGISVKAKIAQGICAFLNSEGGYLFIGVNDDGSSIGLSHDYSLAGGKKAKDYFRLEFDDTIKRFFPVWIKENIVGDFYTVDKQEIFVIAVHPSRSRPVFMNGQNEKEFYVRWTASSRQYKDIEDIVTYCLLHWNSNNNP